MSSTDDMQAIPARHGTATFVPKGSTIKIVNTSGTQVVDTWAFLLPDPPKALKPGSDEATQAEQEAADKKEADKEEPKKEAPKQEKKQAEAPNTKKGRKSKDMGLPTQEEAEAATAKGISEAEQQAQQEGTPQKAGWSSYIPSLRGSGKKQQAPQATEAAAPAEEEKDSEAVDKSQQKQNSRTWGSYLSTGQGFTSYLPSKGAISAFATSHQRDTSKSYAEQLADFSKTPVGAAGFSALTGSGTASSLYAGYSAWNSGRSEHPAMEYLSLPHTRASTLHMIPKVDDVLVSNLREPMLTLVEDTSKGQHDTLIAACDPKRYKELGVENWEEHGSCAENLVLALKELNERAGLKGVKGIGADVTINSVPSPLNLFMNIPWAGNKGQLKFLSADCKAGDYVRLRAERDVVVVMSACPQDQLDINGKDRSPTDAHFLVETPDDDSEDDDVDVKQALEKATATDKKKPRKLGANNKKTEDAPPSSNDKDAKPAPVAEAKKPAEQKKASPSSSSSSGNTPATATPTAKSDRSPSTPAAAAAPAAQKSAASAPAPAASPAPAAAKPKGKPKKLVDPSTGEKKKPKKLEKRGSAAPSSNGGKDGGSQAGK